MDETVTLDVINGMGPAAAASLLRPACASDAWVGAVVAGRPYDDRATLDVRSDAAIDDLIWPDVEQALQAHPRIGERAGDDDRGSAWSRDEQSAADDPARAGELARGNVEYEQRFGHVFLICATGRTSGEILDALHRRLRNDPGTEQQVVRRELAAIARLRLAKVIA